MGGVSGGGEGEDAAVWFCIGPDDSIVGVGVRDAGLSTREYRFTVAGTGDGAGGGGGGEEDC